LAQTRKPDRFVVIDNASTDDSRQIAVDMRIEVVDADNKYKFITGLNTAMSLLEEEGDLLIFMQNDVCLESSFVEHMDSIIFPKNFIAQPVIYQTNGKIDNAGMDIYWPGFGQRRNKKWWKYDDIQPCGMVTTICFITDLINHRYSVVFSPAYYEDVSFKLEYPEVEHLLIPTAKAIHKGNHTFSESYKKHEIVRFVMKTG
jgi:GT2 family glycosyltransferase